MNPFWRQRVWLLAAMLFAVSVRSHAAGVTLITHGFNSNVEGWVIPMAEAVPQYPAFRGTNFSCYEISITLSGGNYIATPQFLGGVGPTASDSGEILIKLDWSTLSGLGGASTLNIANAAAAALLSTNFLPTLGGRALAQLPLHLIGHSRGASVVTEMARVLGGQGVWVDHVTMLDPRPVSGLGDPSMKNYANILFADNYWQNLGDGLFVPNGQSIPGAYNRQLTSLSGGYSSSHSDVHHWYHGTIQFMDFRIDSASVSNSERTTWWTAAEQRGTNAGFRWSRLGGGDRRRTIEPAVNSGWRDLSVNVPANRVALPINSAAWPNPLLFGTSATNPLPAGEAIAFSLTHQSGSNTNALIQMRLFLDADDNPFNTNELLVLQSTLSGTGTNAFATTNGFFQPDPALVLPGKYRLFAQLSHGPHSRVLYAASSITLTRSEWPPRLAVIGVSQGQFQFRVHGYPGQTLFVDASPDFVNWAPVATNVLSSSTITLSNSILTPHRFYRATLLP